MYWGYRWTFKVRSYGISSAQQTKFILKDGKKTCGNMEYIYFSEHALS